MNRFPGNLLADFGRIAVEHRDDFEPLSAESLVVEKCGSDIADTDERHAPDPVRAHYAANFPGEEVHPVADTGLAELAEMGQIPAHLRGAHAERFA